MRGTEANPNLLRSQNALIDQHGEQLVPIMQGENADFPGHKTEINQEDANAVAAYIHTFLAQIGSQGRAPGNRRDSQTSWWAMENGAKNILTNPVQAATRQPVIFVASQTV